MNVINVCARYTIAAMVRRRAIVADFIVYFPFGGWGWLVVVLVTTIQPTTGGPGVGWRVVLVVAGVPIVGLSLFSVGLVLHAHLLRGGSVAWPWRVVIPRRGFRSLCSSSSSLIRCAVWGWRLIWIRYLLGVGGPLFRFISLVGGWLFGCQGAVDCPNGSTGNTTCQGVNFIVLYVGLYRFQA